MAIRSGERPDCHCALRGTGQWAKQLMNQKNLEPYLIPPSRRARFSLDVSAGLHRRLYPYLDRKSPV